MKLNIYMWVGPEDQRHQLLALAIARNGKEAEQIVRQAYHQDGKISKEGEAVIVKNVEEAWQVFSRVLEQRPNKRDELVGNFKALVLLTTDGKWRYVPRVRELIQDCTKYPSDTEGNLEAVGRIITALTAPPPKSTSSQ